MENEIIKNKILTIREKKIILDMDLAKLYEVETRVLKQAVRRNLDRFPEDFIPKFIGTSCFELHEDEMNQLVSQNVIPSQNVYGGAKPFAFTEQGISMLSSVLKSKKAIQINISIMRAFVLMREWALNYQELAEKLNQLEKKFGKQITDIEQVLNFLVDKDIQKIQQEKRKKIGFKK